MSTKLPVRVLHDYFSIMGGGERLALTLAHGLGAELAFGRWDTGSFPRREADGLMTRDLGLRNWPLGLRTVMLAKAFEHAVKAWPAAAVHLYSGVCAPLAARTDQARRRVMYCHTPPRFLFDQRDFFRAQLPPLARPLMDALNQWLEPRYRDAVARMDQVIANSEHVRERIKRYLGVVATVVYPPCDLERFSWRASNGFYLSNARLDPLKRVDRIIAAFLKLPQQQLVVASTGPELNKLKLLAADAPNIRFVGRLSDAEMASYLGECRALIYVPVDEDFGISPIEAMAAGKPVIAARAGGLTETLIDQETALFIDAQAPIDALMVAIEQLDATRAQSMRAACEHRAQQFSRARFLAQMREISG